RCPSSQAFSLVGRNVDPNGIQECFQCCSTHGCNKHICELTTDHVGGISNMDCSDKLMECVGLNALEHICTNISLAKTICKRYCGLCNLMDGGWSSWSTWSMCSASCGLGLESRTRTCSNPYPSNGGDHCPGNATQQSSCFLRSCPGEWTDLDAALFLHANHGGWSGWQAWGSCSSRCGVGLMKRYRQCNNPPPSLYGHYCIGDPYEYELCNGTICGGYTTALDGAWSDWTEWSDCTVTCDNGTTTRTRDCSNPVPAHGGKDCVGNSRETLHCPLYKCPVHGGWSVWGDWSLCSVTCGMGLTHRRRNCDNPTPSHDGNMCFGDPIEYNLCTNGTCAVNGGWTLWGSWSTCSSSCGTGMWHRDRTCTNPVPDNGGRYCDGQPTDYSNCQIQSCEVNGGWTSWTSWGQCVSSTNCGTGIQTMTRTCTNPRPAHGGVYCDGDAISYRECPATSNCTARLVSGRLELMYNGIWGTVCDDRFTDKDAIVACRMMGQHGTSSVIGADSVPDGADPIWLDEVSCLGTETNLFQCVFYQHTIGMHDCFHSEDVGVHCS
ncbi:hypothetical protein ACJMK2_038927, partial [Sinanodonta woodiana]